ncbi:HAD-IC family P-type ATPase [Clostridium sp.]|uniref:cation-translocating P-type ATPase n=1 Tax=Clostridium sp. TaxID=1506 RepID=UPI00284AFC14|nr:HAD-IC family P-type ATPase [Clostridium sp.]MDR3597411.1 HAD-IC family P-type ATPase [Clostridium sp.]
MSLAYNEISNEMLYKRIRIYIEYIYRSQEKALEMEKLVNSVVGVKYCKANDFTGSLLVVYDDEIINENCVKQQIYRFVSKKMNKSLPINMKDVNSAISKKSVNFESIEKTLELKRSKEVLNKTINEKSNNNYHYIETSDIEKELKTNFRKGLSKLQVDEKLKEIGLNVISEAKRKSMIAKFFENINEFSTKLLVGVGLLSFVLGQIVDAVAILGIAAVETMLSTLQQHKAEKSLYSLKEMMVRNATVIRNGKQRIIDAKYVVPGDVIIIEAGEKVPADARIIESYELKVSEATLTGESTSVCKSPSLCQCEAELADRYNMLYMGTDILSGRGKAVVVATGKNTEIGKIAYILQNIKNESTPIENKIKKFTNKITKLAFGICMGISALGLLRGTSLVQVFILGVSFAIGAIPESLPAVVTAAMSLSVQKMASKNAIVRKLPAVETLGSANVICCDKTGTLTMNEMTVKEIYVDNNTYEIRGTGYNPKGDIVLKSGRINKKESLDKIITSGIICNNSNISNCDGKWQIHGDPTEGALLVAAYKNKVQIDEITNKYERIKEIPFDSSTRYMTVLVKHENEKEAYCKGSLSKVLDKCTRIYENGKERLLNYTDKERLKHIADEMGTKALRVLAFAYKKVLNDNKNIDNNFVFLGLVGMEDPPREEVKECIEKCKGAGIKVVMITGDNKNTAAAIGRKIGLLTDGIVLSGAELDDISDDKLTSIINKIQVFARTSPEQKYKIVKAFKRAGNVVAMTGDGVNDAPAIKEADIGIAMGKNGSDVARDTADIILTDDNFATIVAAIEEGRAVNLNIKNSMRYLLSGCLGEIVAILFSSMFIGIPLLLSLQILWTDVVSESILGASLTFEKPSNDIMKNPPISKDYEIIDRELKRKIVRTGVITGLTTFGIFQGSLWLGASLQKARTLAFTNLVLSQIVSVYNCKSDKDSKNKYMNISAIACVAMFGGMLYIPFIGSFFSTVPLNIKDLLILSGTTTLSTI